MKDKTYVHWSACWEAECKRVAAAVLGCAVITVAALLAPRRLQTRYSKSATPAAQAATLVKAFCAGGDSAASANRSVQLDTLDLLLPTPHSRRPPRRRCRRRQKGRNRRPPRRAAAPPVTVRADSAGFG